ncbi:MAG: flagellar export protein FliJ [Oleispira antarctica]|uniref:Flagellar FliJ protein n=1 Tax=Oleispira antarctica RB-8 TaxID=698738 RepID=R4YQ66_OLEAN|nr:flagellar export protein FliJ [Oleispira antarctica]MBQ0791062.1 flagellar export protein FliJ [Oleispira antarctica]CCK75393.1 Flagellar biosynthesis chaperone [Oleispira antarctica RB-8]|tara:strand:+ start:1392 stop:1841 length:450 start_codon:yes stop_codon:yes gene_type:complete
MSKQRVKRLGFVLKMAADKEQQDLKVWGQYQQKLEQEVGTLTQLEQYMTEYRSSLTSQHAAPIQGGQIQNTIAFIEQIKEASGHQQQQIDLVQQQAEGAKRVYLAARAKAEALRKLIEKLNLQAYALEEKQDQKMMDEFAARSARNRQL